MQDKDLFGGIIGKYSDCRVDEAATNGIRKNDDYKMATNASAARPRKSMVGISMHSVLLFHFFFSIHSPCCRSKCSMVAVVVGVGVLNNQFFTFFLPFSWPGLSACTNNITIFRSIHGIHVACEHFRWHCGHG